MATILNEMPVDKVTERDGHWFLRHAVTDLGHHVFVVSAHAPEGTRAGDLVPAKLDVLPSDDWDGNELTFDVDELRHLIDWSGYA